MNKVFGTAPPPRKRKPVSVVQEEESSSEQGTTKQSVCVDILLQGNVQAFVDFFYLSHRPNPNPNPSLLPEEVDEITIDPEELVFLKDKLCDAEEARRDGNPDAVYSCFNHLATHFQENKDFRTAIYFFEKCLEVSQIRADPHGEEEANHNLGLAYELTGDLATAIQYHEAQLSLASRLKDDLSKIQANSELLRLYCKQAESLEEAKDFVGAISMYQRMLQASQAAKNRIEEGSADFRLGRAHILSGEPDQAVHYIEEYLKIVDELGDIDGKGKAFSALAAAYQVTDNIEKATEYLEREYEISIQTEQLSAQAEACHNLGTIYNNKCDFARAVQYFEKNFDINRQIVAKGEGPRSLLDKARVNLGMARANAQFSQFMHVINFDLPTLLKWKNKRLPFQPQIRS